MEYRIVRYNPKYLKSLVKLLDEAFDIKNKYKQELVKWKFSSPSKKTPVTFIALSGNEIVAHYSNIPLTISYNNHALDAGVCIDMATHPKHRGKGLISKLSKKVYEEVEKQLDLSIGFSNDAGVMVDKHSSGYGYHIVGPFERYYHIGFLPVRSTFQIKPLSDFSKTFFPSSNIHYEKHIAYLSWRYLKRPGSSYQICGIYENKELKGYVILRFVKLRLYIYDIVTSLPLEKHLGKIFNSIQNYAFHHGTAIVICTVLNNTFWQAFFQQKGYRKRTKTKVHYYLTVKFHNLKLSQDIFLNPDNWFLMGGDIL